MCDGGGQCCGGARPVYKDVWTARPVLLLFTLPVLIGEHVNQVASERVVLLGKPLRLIATILSTYTLPYTHTHWLPEDICCLCTTYHSHSTIMTDAVYI